MRESFDGLAGFTRDDEQRLRDIDVTIERSDRLGDGGIECVKFRIARRARKSRSEQLRALRRTAHPEQYDVAEAGISYFIGKRREFFHALGYRLGHIQKAKTFLNRLLDIGVLRPESRVLLPQSRGEIVLVEILVRRAHLRFVTGRRDGLLVVRPINDCGAPTLDDRAQILERLRERLDALFLQFLADLDQIDSDRRQPLDDVARFRDAFLERRTRLTVVAERIHRRRRHRVDRVGADEFLDVLDVAVRVILGAGACPQRPLRTPTFCAHVFEASAAEKFLVALVDEPRVRDRRFAHQRRNRFVRRRLQLVLELAIDQGLDAADEHARDRPDFLDRLVRLQPRFETADKRLGHTVVMLHRKHQRHVDVDALGN